MCPNREFSPFLRLGFDCFLWSLWLFWILPGSLSFVDGLLGSRTRRFVQSTLARLLDCLGSRWLGLFAGTSLGLFGWGLFGNEQAFLRGSTCPLEPTKLVGVLGVCQNWGHQPNDKDGFGKELNLSMQSLRMQATLQTPGRVPIAFLSFRSFAKLLIL